MKDAEVKLKNQGSPGTSCSKNENNSASAIDFDSIYSEPEGYPESYSDFKNMNPPQKMNNSKELDCAVHNKEQYPMEKKKC